MRYKHTHEGYTPIDTDETMHARMQMLHAALNRLNKVSDEMAATIKTLAGDRDDLAQQNQRLRDELASLETTFDTLLTTQRRIPNRGIE